MGYMYQVSPFEEGVAASAGVTNHDGKAAKWFDRAAEQVRVFDTHRDNPQPP